MTTVKLSLVSFGSARNLTRDGTQGPYIELNMKPSRVPA